MTIPSDSFTSRIRRFLTPGPSWATPFHRAEPASPREAGGKPSGSRCGGRTPVPAFTLPVDDVDAMYEELTSRGVTLLNGPMDRPWGIRTASFKDPGGHIWEIAQ
ncbi:MULTISPECIES: VOC family protein [Streptomyces]|uniref:VOC family protein n=1 Tax=Streptomyces TaxID=1883 RepID=UPI001587306B|nr:VOC family protein [Streptomyces sp. CAI-85]